VSGNDVIDLSSWKKRCSRIRDHWWSLVVIDWLSPECFFVDCV